MDLFQLVFGNEFAQLNWYLIIQQVFKNELTELNWFLLWCIKVESTWFD